MLGHQANQLLRRLLISEQGVDLAEVAEVDHGVAAKLGVVGGQEHLAGVGDDGLAKLRSAGNSHFGQGGEQRVPDGGAHGAR